jgi:drug/metabolite transporter (DMT)-like permease
MVLSVFLFAEIPTALQWVGFALAVGAIILINYEKGAVRSGGKILLVLMLLAGGTSDAMSKVFEVYGPGTLANQFLLYTFTGAFLLAALLVLRSHERPDKYALLFGVLVGVPNFFSAKFLLMALDYLPAVIVYPTFSVATILLVTLAGVALFKERLGKRQWAALGVILVALVLLNL